MCTSRLDIGSAEEYDKTAFNPPGFFPVVNRLMLAELCPLDQSPVIRLEQDITVVGRKPGLCDLVIEHGGVSKLQAMLVKTDGLLYLRDLSSTNGTRVNGQRTIRGALLPGDEIAFGSIRYRVRLGPDPKPADKPVVFGEAKSDSDVRPLTESELADYDTP